MSGAQGTKLSWTSIFLYSAYLFSSYSPMQILWQSPESRGRKYILPRIQFTSVQLLSHIQLFATPWIAACQASLSITNSRSSPKLMSIELVMPSSHLILCHPLLLLPQIPPSIRVFSNESTLCMRRPKYWLIIQQSQYWAYTPKKPRF